MEDALRYPIGKFSRPQTLTTQERAEAIAVLEALPHALYAAVRGLNETQLDTPYREGGWTVRQVVHHLADSNMLLAGRIQLALTEEWPTVVPMNEDRGAELVDARTAPVEHSLILLDGLHARWVLLLRAVSPQSWTTRGFQHPANGKENLEQILARIAWHSRHHTAHITGLRQRMGW